MPIPRQAEIKNGIMGLLNFTCTIQEKWRIAAELGYKTKGFVLDQPIQDSKLMHLTIQWIATVNKIKL